MLMLAQTTQASEAAPWYATTFLNNTAGQWLATLGAIVLTLAAGRIVSFLLRRQGKWWQQRARGRAFGALLCAMSGPSALLILAAGLYLIAQLGLISLDIAAAPGLKVFYIQICKTIAVLAVGWGIYRLVDGLETFLLKWTSKTRTELDDELVPIIRKGLRVFVIIVVLLFIAQNIFAWDIGALLAGLGIGGLALALAAQDALKNLFGSIIIFADRPFQMGDRVQVGDHVGNIEQVGFRSTRIRTLEGHLVTVPNATIAGSAVENIGRRPTIRRVLNVTVTYDTPPRKVERAVEILREMLQARKAHFPEDLPGQVYFNDFNAASLNIIVYYWFTPPDWWEYLQFAHDFNMELLRRYNEEGIEFAFPTQTLYLKQDSEFSIARKDASG